MGIRPSKRLFVGLSSLSHQKVSGMSKRHLGHIPCIVGVVLTPQTIHRGGKSSERSSRSISQSIAVDIYAYRFTIVNLRYLGYDVAYMFARAAHRASRIDLHKYLGAVLAT